MNKVVHSVLVTVEGGTGGVTLHTYANLGDSPCAGYTVGRGNRNNHVCHTVDRRLRALRRIILIILLNLLKLGV